MSADDAADPPRGPRRTVAVLGATGLMGGLVRARLEGLGHQVIPVSRASGVDVLDAESLREALAGADVVVDCLNRQTVSARPAVRFFRAAATHVVAAVRDLVADSQASPGEAGAGGRRPRIVCVSIVRCDDPRVNRWLGYYRGKAAQEGIYREAAVADPGLDVAIVRTTQWYELAESLLDQIRVGGLAVVPAMVSRPLAAAEAADQVVAQALAAEPTPLTQVCGPERLDLARAASRINARTGRARRVLRVPIGRTPLGDGSLIPEAPDVIAPTRFDAWLDGRS